MAIKTQEEKDFKTKVKDSVNNARARIEHSAKKTDEYVKKNTWKAISIAAGVGALAGTITGFILGRKK